MADKNEPEDLSEWGEDQAIFLPTWDFSKEPVLVGTIIDQETVKDVVGASGEPRDVQRFTIVSTDGEKYTVWGSAVLDRILPRHMNHRVRIEDKGENDLGGGRSFRYFDVRCSDSVHQ